MVVQKIAREDIRSKQAVLQRDHLDIVCLPEEFLHDLHPVALRCQQNQENQKKIGSDGGMDNLLQLTSSWKKKDPKDSDESEMIQNLFDSICSCVMVPENLAAFVEGEGIELMVIMLQARKFAARCALKVSLVLGSRLPQRGKGAGLFSFKKHHRLRKICECCRSQNTLPRVSQASKHSGNLGSSSSSSSSSRAVIAITTGELQLQGGEGRCERRRGARSLHHLIADSPTWWGPSLEGPAKVCGERFREGG